MPSSSSAWPGSRPRWRPTRWVRSSRSARAPLQTGIKVIDVMSATGGGQRELIIGHRKPGKTAVAIDTISHQRGLGVKWIYVAIGQKWFTVAEVVNNLEAASALEYRVVVN